MIWLKRLFYLPRLIQLHVQQCILTVDVNNANEALYLAIDMCEPNYKVDLLAKNLESLAEELYDLRAQIMGLWGVQ